MYKRQIINAAGANTLRRLRDEHGLDWNSGSPDSSIISDFYDVMNNEDRRASTVASAIEINRPVNLPKALRALSVCDGVVREVPDEAILDAKAKVGVSGFGCEPASGASVAGAKLLREQGIIGPSDRVVCILTGHQLKDSDVTVRYHSGDSNTDFGNRPTVVENDTEAILKLLNQVS